MAICNEDDYVPLEKRFPGLLEDLDSSIRDSVSGIGDESATFYALAGVANIKDLRMKVNNPQNIKVLKVMHCNQLVSTEGLEEYGSLEHLDLSNNQLESYNAVSLTDIIYLNLS